jgi:tetratricopeptide (TPR) repeat protein
LAQNVVPGQTTPDNLKTAQQSIDIFKQVLAEKPHDVNSMKQIAGIYFSIKQLDDAKDWQKKVLAEDKNDAEAAYTVGVIDWTQAHENMLKALSPAGYNDDGEGNVKVPKKIMAPLKEENGPLIDEALKFLDQALEDRPTYDDAMTYKNLIYRRKADVDYGDAAAVKDDIAQAKDWTSKSMGMRKANEEKKSKGPGGITIDSSGNLK